MNPVGAEDSLARARATYDARRFDLAVRFLLDAIALEPNDPGAHILLSLSYDRLGRLAEAEAAAERAIALDPERSQAHVAFGIVRLSQRRFTEAIASFADAARLDARNDDAYRLAAIAQMNQAHFHDAQRMIERALEIDPDAIATREVHAMILRLLGRRSDAEVATATVLRMHPESVLGLSQEGMLRLQRGEPAKARAAFREALRLDPNSESVRAGYERVVLKSTPYAQWCGPPLVVVGLFFFFSYGAASRIEPELAFACIFTACVVWLLNRPLAFEALHSDEIGRTFLEPRQLARNRQLIAYAALCESTLFVAVPLHRPEMFLATSGFLFAAIAIERAMRAALGARVRAFYAVLAHALALACAIAAAAFVTRDTADPKGASATFDVLCALALVPAALALATFVVCDLVFVAPSNLRAAGERIARRGG